MQLKISSNLICKLKAVSTFFILCNRMEHQYISKLYTDYNNLYSIYCKCTHGFMV